PGGDRLNGADHRDQERRIERLGSEEGGRMALRDDDDVERRDRPRVVEREHEVVLEHALDRRLPAEDVLAEPVALLALSVVRDVDVWLGHAPTLARGARWQRGQ